MTLFINVFTKEILIINSYSYSFPLTKDILNGITDGFDRTKTDINLHIEYLESSYENNTKEQQEMSEFIKFKYQKNRFDLVICTDIEAIQFIEKYGKEQFKDVPVIFGGLDYFESEMIKNIKNIKGVYEKTEFNSMFEFLNKKYKGKKIIIINDFSENGKLLRKNIERTAINSKNIKFIGENIKNSRELFSYIKTEKNSAVFILGFMSYYQDGSKISSFEIEKKWLTTKYQFTAFIKLSLEKV